jgi:serine/threonine-protein kinase
VDPHPTDPLPPVEPPAERRFGWGLALGLLILLIAGVGGLAGWVIAQGNEKATTVTQTIASTTGQAATGEVQVPEVVGLSEDEAVVRLADAGLQSQERFKPSSKSTGNVLSQEPAAGGKVPKRSTVVLVIDRGAPKSATVEVPSVTGQRVSEAQERLRAAGLESSVFVVPSNEPRGTVTSQDPKAGADTARRTPVRLNVSAGSTTTTTTTTPTTTAPSTTAPTTTTTPGRAIVPDVVGLPEDEAREQLRSAGLRASVVRVASQEPEGTVVAQAKPPGTSLPRGSTVQINVSSGPGG